MSLFSTIRLSIFCTSVAFSLVVLGILANFTNITSSEGGFYFHSFALGIATSSMTLIAVVTSLIVDKLRTGAFTSLVFIELGWTGLLWVLWLATAGAITSLGLFTTCGFYNATVESNCRQYQAVQAFSWLAWLLFFGWFTTLLILSIIAASRGDSKVWKSSSTEYPFFSGHTIEPSKNEYGNNAPYSPYASPAPAYPNLNPAQAAMPYGRPEQPGSNAPYQPYSQPAQPHSNYQGPPQPFQQPYGQPEQLGSNDPQLYQQPYGRPEQPGSNAPQSYQPYSQPGQPHSNYQGPPQPYQQPYGQPQQPYSHQPSYPQV